MSRLLKNWSSLMSRRPSDRSSVRKYRSRPQIESLEGRQLLTTFSVTNTLDTGPGNYIIPGSLRSAILASNANPGQGDINHIQFDLPAGSFIFLKNSLPPVTAAVDINGFTAAGSQENTLLHGENTVIGVLLEGDGAYTGMYIDGPNVRVEGMAFTGFTNDGMWIFPGADNTVIQGDRFDYNGGDGIHIESSNNVIGSEVDPGHRNLMFGNARNGIEIDNALYVGGSTPQSNYVGENWIGVNDSGYAVGNKGDGIKLEGTKLNQIGGQANALAGNVIANNVGPGIVIHGVESQYNSVGGNDIHNNWDGVFVAGGATYNSIGQGQQEWSNTIHENTFDGVVLASGTTNNFVSENSIYDNGLGGIIVGNTANQGIKAPVVTSAVEGPSSLTITGTFHGLPNAGYEIDLFDNPNQDHYRDEGMNYLAGIGLANGSTDAQGNGTFTITLPMSVKVGDAITAQAGGSEGYSAFSQPAYVTTMNARKPPPVALGQVADIVGVGAATGGMLVQGQAQRLTDAALQAFQADGGVSSLASRRKHFS